MSIDKLGIIFRQWSQQPFNGEIRIAKLLFGWKRDESHTSLKIVFKEMMNFGKFLKF